MVDRKRQMNHGTLHFASIQRKTKGKMRVLGLPKKLFREGSSSPSKSSTISTPVVLPSVEAVSPNTFPTVDQRTQLQSMGKQSCTSLKRLALSMAMLRETWEKLDTENNMEMYHLKDNDDHDGTIHVCGVAHVHATLQELMPLLQLPMQKTYTMDKPTGAKTLVNEMFSSQTLVQVDEQTSIQWLAMKCADGMIHRDFVVLQRMDHFTKGDDIQCHTISLHSMDFPGAPPQFDQIAVTNPPDAYRFIRGGMYRSGFVILEDANRPGILDVFGLFKVDFKGEKHHKLFRSTLTQWLHFLGSLNQHFLSEKLHAKGAPRIRQAPSTGIKSKAKRCECCNQPFKFQLQFRAPVRDQCLMCGAIICSSCKINYKPKEEEKNQVFCIPCLVKWNPDTTKSIKFIQPTNLPGQNPSPRPAPTNTEGVPLLAEIPSSPPAKSPEAKPSLSPRESKDRVAFDAPLGEPRLRSEMNDVAKPRRRSDGREESHWIIRGERSYSVPEASRPATSIAIMDTINLDSLDYRVSLYGRFSISTASKTDLEARLEWIAASIQAMETTVAQFTKDGKLRRAMQVMEEKKALHEESLQVQTALDAYKEETRSSMQEDLECKVQNIQNALEELAAEDPPVDLRAKREHNIRQTSLRGELKEAQEALQNHRKSSISGNRRELNGSLLFNPEIFALDGQMDVLRAELHHCVSQLATAAKHNDLENIEILTAQRLEIKNKMSLIQDQLVVLGAPSVGNRSSVAARRSTITLFDPTAPLNLSSDVAVHENIEKAANDDCALTSNPGSIESKDSEELTFEAVMHVEPNAESEQATKEVALDLPREAECHYEDEDQLKQRPASIVVLDEAVPYCRLTDDMDEDYPKEIIESLDKPDGVKSGEVLLSDRCIRLYTVSNHRLDLTDNSFDFKAVKTFAL